ncbi:MAG: MarR family winged helix-turn-helix transcriptional regulator [Solirubrobacteraceae bacterium]
MTPPGDETIRQLLNRRDLASARHRTAMSRRLGLSESEMLAVAHLAQHGRLSPSGLGRLLDLSSGGITALIQRLESEGHLVRRRHPSDGRSVLLELSRELVTRAEQAFGPLVSDLERASVELTEDERRVVRRFLDRAVALSEEHAQRAREQPGRREPLAPAPSPGLWG